MIASLLTALFLMLPGALLLPYKPLCPKLLVIEKVLAMLGVSCAYWIAGYWMTSLIPFSRVAFVTVSAGFFSLVIFRYRDRYLEYIRMQHGNTFLQLGILVFVCILMIPQVAIVYLIPAPSGMDMSMHAYIARIIFDSHTFPNTMEPLLPVRHFGIYPFGFSALVALLATVNRLPIHTNALFFAAFSHIFLDISVYLLLRKKYPVGISAAATILVLWIGQNPHMFMIWGANPTVLALGLLFTSLAILPKVPDIWTIALSGALLYASFLINYMPAIALIYIGVILFPWYRKYIHTISKLDRFPLLILGFAAAVSPFMIRLIMSGFTISRQVSEFTRAFRTEELSGWTGSLDWSVIPFLYRHFSETYHPYLMLMYGGFLIWIAFRNRNVFVLNGVFLLGLIVLILNSRYGWLPFSAVLYPLRISLLLVIPITYALSEMLSAAQRYSEHIRLRRLYTAVIALSLCILFVRENIVTRYIRLTLQNANVTHADIGAFSWLSDHTGIDDIILNDYDDAGLWIPAIAGRRITTVQTNPVDFNEIRMTPHARATYAYIGRLNPTLTIESLLSENPETERLSYTPVYQHEGARIYRLFLPARPATEPTRNR